MRSLFLVAFVFFCAAANAKNYYVSSAGSDANAGTSTTAAWKTIAKVNASFSTIVAGDSILFRRGDVFYGALVIGKSGSSGKPIVLGAYGTGAKPVISGFTTLTTWTSVGNGIYQAAVPAAKTSLNMVTLNGTPKALGRYPNADDANGGYLSYETFSGYTSITDDELTSTTNWKGAEVVIRKRLWVLDRCNITAHSGGTLTYTNTNGSVYTGTNNFGYFIQNDARTLDQLGEWFLNKSTKNLQMYFGTAAPAGYTVKASTLDTLVTISSKNYITLDNIAFEGSNGNSIYAASCSYLNILNCDISNSGQGAISTSKVANLVIDGCNTNYILNNAIVLSNSSSTDNTIRNCSVKNTGTLPGMGLSNGGSYKAINASVSSNLTVEYNTVDTTGYVGIQFQGNNVTIKNNVVNYFDFVVDDAGGIYSYSSGTDASPGTTYTNRNVIGNLVMNGVGAPNGRSTATLFVSGIYMDGRTMNVNILNNSVFNNGKNGIHCNNPNGVTVSGNTSFNNLNSMSVMRWANIGNIKSLSIKNNIFYTKKDSQRSFYYTNSGLNEPATNTVDKDIQALGNIDTNYYSMINPVSFNFEIYGTTGGALIQTSPASLEGWKSFSSHDSKSKKPAKLPTEYKLNSLVGSNLFTNAAFTSNVTGITTSGTSVTSAWDNTGKISGGALKISFSAPSANKYSTSLCAIGAVSAAKKYILRLSTYGSNEEGIIKVYLRKSASPYTNLTEIQTNSFGSGIKNHEFLFDAPTSDASASIVIQIEQNSGTTYIDNLVFSEANATVYNTDDQLRFEYNATKSARTVSLGANYIGVDGTKYSGSITLAPFTSAILVKDTGTVVTTPPPAATALKATATSAVINCFGSTTTTTVSASGGKSPYTGTGTFTVSAGKGAVKVTPITPKTGSYISMYYTIGAVSSSKNYVLRFSTLRSAGTATLRASIRQTFTPWTVITTKQVTTIGTSRIDHSFLFTAPTTQAAASFLIEVEQTAGDTYVDNIAFFEATSTGELIGNNLYTTGQLETDLSRLIVYSGNANHTAVWDNTGKISSIYYYNVKDSDTSSAVVEVKTSQPAAALAATATASGKITTSGGTTTIVVAATGGTAPYTGTGSFVKGIGTYNYTVTDANGCTSVASITLTLSAARTANTSVPATVAATAPTVSDAAIPQSLSLAAYPNPTTSSFGLKVQGGTGEKLSVTVYSAAGNVMYQTTGNTNSIYNFGNGFNAGVYVVKVIQGNTLQTLKLIKTQ